MSIFEIVRLQAGAWAELAHGPVHIISVENILSAIFGARPRKIISARNLGGRE
jgi:hypothetical protein